MLWQYIMAVKLEKLAKLWHRSHRGIAEITAYCEQNQLELERIFTDQQTGKDFNRPRYQVLKEDVLRSGDELIITEVDRLGRNKKETLSELQYFRDHNIRVKILELPTTLMDIEIGDFNIHYQKVIDGQMRPTELMKQLGISKSTYYLITAMLTRLRKCSIKLQPPVYRKNHIYFLRHLVIIFLSASLVRNPTPSDTVRPL